MTKKTKVRSRRLRDVTTDTIKLPSSVTLGAHVIPIRREHSLLDDLEAFGIFDPQKLEILVHDKVSDSVARETLWHELVEAMNYLAEADLEHRIIQIFGLLLHQAVESMYELTDQERS